MWRFSREGGQIFNKGMVDRSMVKWRRNDEINLEDDTKNSYIHVFSSWHKPYTPFKPNSSPGNFTGETSFSPGKRPVWKVGGEKFPGERRVTSPGNFSTYRGG